jgi:hypothetical protein
VCKQVVRERQVHGSKGDKGERGSTLAMVTHRDGSRSGGSSRSGGNGHGHVLDVQLHLQGAVSLRGETSPPPLSSLPRGHSAKGLTRCPLHMINAKTEVGVPSP